MSKEKNPASMIRNWLIFFIMVIIVIGVLVFVERPRIELTCASSHQVRSLQFSPDGAVIASGGGEGVIKLWDMKTGACIRSLREHKGSVKALDYSSDGRYLASAGEDRVVRLWDAISYKCIRMLKGHTSTVNSLSFSKDGAYCASGSSDGTIRVWESATGKSLRSLKAYEGCGVNTVSFSGDGRYIASAEESGFFKTGGVSLWNWRTGKVAEVFGKPSAFSDDQSSSDAALFSPDGRYIAAWTRWGSYMVILDSQNGSLIRRWGSSEFTGFLSACLSQKSNLVAISGEGKGICVWKAGSGESVSTSKDSSYLAECLCFSPGAEFIASGDGSGIRIWDVRSGKLLILIAAFDENEWACWTPDARYHCSSAAEQRLLISFRHFKKSASSLSALLNDPDIMKKRLKTGGR